MIQLAQWPAVVLEFANVRAISKDHGAAGVQPIGSTTPCVRSAIVILMVSRKISGHMVDAIQHLLENCANVKIL